MQLFNLVAIYARPVKPVQETSNLIPDSVTKPNLYAEDANPDKSYQDLLQPDEISTVIIALRILTQPSFIEAALSAGKHVLAKKSTAKDAAATRIIIANARRICSTSNAAFAVAENIRFCHSFAYAAREAAELGKVHTFSVRVLWHIEPDNKWLNTAAWGGQQVRGGTGFTAQMCERLPSIDTVNAIIKTQSGVAGVFQNSALSLLQAVE
ncbi:hypothetical protein Trco_004637 [Trichoderma cornu-damae]|uniref:Gfo/Idh/MocA-like oxidoreductase N-terminal domain-containing protein n=1 Tax=Trichoderma cornu-damae TaxID=654480 RepID=A0A9P8TVP9_9HYPO|nr:hypothetical protein Trco_004637 [Trichoderma cornu-damae]